MGEMELATPERRRHALVRWRSLGAGPSRAWERPPAAPASGARRRRQSKVDIPGAAARGAAAGGQAGRRLMAAHPLLLQAMGREAEVASACCLTRGYHEWLPHPEGSRGGSRLSAVSRWRGAAGPASAAAQAAAKSASQSHQSRGQTARARCAHQNSARGARRRGGRRLIAAVCGCGAVPAGCLLRAVLPTCSTSCALRAACRVKRGPCRAAAAGTGGTPPG
jgi:hypothetical protein